MTSITIAVLQSSRAALGTARMNDFQGCLANEARLAVAVIGKRLRRVRGVCVGTGNKVNYEVLPNIRELPRHCPSCTRR